MPTSVSKNATRISPAMLKRRERRAPGILTAGNASNASHCGATRRRLALAALLLAGLLPQFATADSLWKEESVKPMFVDKRATAVGDIVTIVVQENNSASKDSSTKTAKKSSVNAQVNQFLYAPGASGLLTKNGQMPGMGFSTDNSFNGSGSVGSSETIVARISVRVVDVLPNHNLIVEGTRQTSFSGETQDVILRGMVRAEDVAANNTVFSYNLADVTIKFTSKGVATDGQKKGWFSKIWDKVGPF